MNDKERESSALQGKSHVEDLQSSRHRFKGLRGDFDRELQTGPWSCGRWSWGRYQLAGADRKESGSSEQWADAVFMMFSSSGFLSALRFCSSSIQLRICSPITEDFICHVFVYSLLAYVRRTLTYSKPGGVFVYTYVCSLRTRDDAQGPGGRWFACQLWIISGDRGCPWHFSVWWSGTEESWGALTSGVKRCLLFLVSKGLGVRRQGSNPNSATVWHWPTSFTTKGLHFLIYITKIL